MPRSNNPQFHRGTGQVTCTDCPFTDAAGKQTDQCLDWSLDECPTVSTYSEAVEYAAAAAPRHLVAFASRINGVVKREVRR